MEAQNLRVGVIGDPIAHSLSPALHQPALDALGIPAAFERWHTTAAELPGRIASLRAPDAIGACVTVPHKVAVIPLIDELAPSARQVGAVNTVINRRGHLVGENTDVYGFATALTATGSDVRGRTALLLGAGGAARAVAAALAGLGVGRIAVANRDPARAARLAADLGIANLAAVAFDEATLGRWLPEASLLVNCTSLGWHPGEIPLAPDLLDRLPADALVADLTYRETDLLRAATERGRRTLDGLGMLVHQGARALELWTGRPAPVDVMMAAARAARDARNRS